MKSMTLFKHVNNSLNPYRWAISVLAAVLISGLFAGVTLESRLDTDKKMAESLAPYLSTLVESSDRPELLRVLQSIGEATKSDVILAQDGMVFASSRSLEELDRAFVKPKTFFRFFDIDFGNNEIVTTTNIKNSSQSMGDSKVYIISPLLPSMKSSLGIFLGVFVASILISLFSARQMRKAIKKALRPMDQLHAEIEGMITDNHLDSEPIQIRELEEIRNTVRSTKTALDNAKDQLAESKAKKLSSDAYKRLIHDLHNPVSALRQMASLAHDETQDLETQNEAANSISRLADQILSQVTSAKKNLEQEPIALRDLNLVDCIREGVRQVQTLENTKSISVSFQDEEITVPHDPLLLKRAIINLLENGIEAANSLVRVSVLKNDNNTIIKVCDDGAGMDESKVPVYLQGRGQSGKANRQAFGLSSTNHIVRSHGGKLIYRKSDLGGSSFEIRLGGI
ncbi:MAG: HAMP domain-containing histidine kinase [Bdellovibrionaceae bacterium]|nr:HAMP domain-containing histidine kinase [Pseudobdellovibrionaceae bacterium]